MVSDGEITVNQDKISKILDLAPPRNVRQLRGFLGMTGYYRKYIPHYARVAAPLFQLVRQDEEFLWGDAQERAFNSLKDHLSSGPILALPNQEEPFIVAVDYSREGMGMVLSQIQAGSEKVIGYFSKSLTGAEARYGVTEGECATIVWALQKVRPYVIGQKFYIITDH